MGDDKKPWEDVPVEIIIEEEERIKREQEDSKRPRLELPLYYPSQSSSYGEPPPQEADEEHMIIIKL
jgi:hypothetical protein